MDNKISKRKASVLATALIVLGMILVIAIGISTVSIQERKSSIGSSRSSTAYQNADTGVEKVLKEILKVRLPSDAVGAINISGASCNPGTGLIEDSGGRFKIELKDTNGQLIGCNTGALISTVSSIKSTGISAQENRSIEAALAQAGGNFGGSYEYYCVPGAYQCGDTCTVAGTRADNPLTGGQSCPSGYTAYCAYSSYDTTHTNFLMICYR